MNFLYRLMGRLHIMRLLVAGSLLVAGPCMAQHLDPFAAGWFQNQYLANPALSGLQEGLLNLHAGYRQEWLSVPDGPQNEYMTGDYGITGRMGVGLKLYNDHAGLLRSSRVMGTYSYHIKLNAENRMLHLGLSAGIEDQRVDISSSNGEPGDISLAKYNDKSLHFDADFGIAYTDDTWTVQAAFPNIAAFYRKNATDAADKPFFFAAAGYKFTLSEEAGKITLTPKACFRGIKGYDNIADAGAEAAFLDDLINVFGMYHTTNNITLGAGVMISNMVHLTAVYATGSDAVKAYTDGSFEIGVGVSLGGKK